MFKLCGLGGNEGGAAVVVLNPLKPAGSCELLMICPLFPKPLDDSHGFSGVVILSSTELVTHAMHKHDNVADDNC